MSKLTVLDLYVRLCGYKILVRANRFACDTAFARVVHDRLLSALDLHRDARHQALTLQHAIQVEPVAEAREALRDMFDDCMADIDCNGRGFYPWHLLDGLDPNPDYRGYFHPVAAMWCHGAIPEWMNVSDEHLCGLRRIIDQIAAETGIRFTAYLCDLNIGPEGAAHLDPVAYENPFGNERYQ